MKIVSILPVHNEQWVLAASIESLLQWCDLVVVLLHNCMDRSREIAERYARVRILIDHGSDWREMEHRQMLLSAARANGATHIAILDADEILTANLLPSIRGMADSLQPCDVLELPGYNLRGGLDRYHANGIWGQRWFSAVFADSPKLSWQGDRFHHRHPMGPTRFRRFVEQGQGGILHLWGASEKRLRARHARYKIMERLRWPDKPVAEIDAMYSLAIHGQRGDRPDQWRYSEVPESWWSDLPEIDLADASVDLEVAALIEQHGASKFDGLDLFGLCEQAHAIST